MRQPQSSIAPQPNGAATQSSRKLPARMPVKQTTNSRKRPSWASGISSLKSIVGRNLKRRSITDASPLGTQPEQTRVSLRGVAVSPAEPAAVGAPAHSTVRPTASACPPTAAHNAAQPVAAIASRIVPTAAVASAPSVTTASNAAAAPSRVSSLASPNHKISDAMFGVMAAFKTNAAAYAAHKARVARAGPIHSAEYTRLVKDPETMNPEEIRGIVQTMVKAFDDYIRQTHGFHFMDEPIIDDGVVLTDRQVAVRRAAGTLPSPPIVTTHRSQSLVDAYGAGGGTKLPGMPSSRVSGSPSANEDSALVPWRLQDCIVGSNVGKGACGHVRLIQDKRTGLPFATKVIAKVVTGDDEADAYSQRDREMEMLFTQLLHHPNIVQVVNVAETAGHVLITMEYLQRGSLFEVLKALAEDGRLLDGLTCRKYCQQMASAVAYCHKSNVVHLDIKSDNFMVDDKDRIRLIDFGFSEAFDPKKQFHMHIGTPEYMSPECALGLAFVGPEADIWSLGVTFYEMVTGNLPIKSQEEQDEECDAYDQLTALQQTFAKKPSRSPMARFEARISFPAKTDKDFVHLARHMLHPVRECRASIDQVLHHPWMTAKGSTSIDTHVPSRPALVASPDLRAVAEVQRFGFSKAAVLTSVATIALDQHNPAVSLYHLAHEKIERQEAFERDVAAERRRAAGQPATALPCAPVAKTDSDKTMAGDDQPPPASDSVRDKRHGKASQDRHIQCKGLWTVTTQSDMPAASVLAEMERVLQSKGIAYTPQAAAATGLAHVLVCEDNRGHRRQARFEIRLEPQLPGTGKPGSGSCGIQIKRIKGNFWSHRSFAKDLLRHMDV